MRQEDDNPRFGLSYSPPQPRSPPEPSSPLGTLGLVNGEYKLDSEDFDEWDEYHPDDFRLILCLAGNTIWGAYDFGMFNGILFLPSRPYRASHEQHWFHWCGRENGEGEVSRDADNEGWIQFLGDGNIRGAINCYGRGRFTGYRISGQETRAPRDARSMQHEWDEYNAYPEYERANVIRLGF